MQAESIRPKIACVQLDSKHADVQANIAQVEALTSHLNAGELDLVVLPEMALTGEKHPGSRFSFAFIL